LGCPTTTDSGAGCVLPRSTGRSTEVGDWRRALHNAQTREDTPCSPPQNRSRVPRDR
jgi:hypothetical protein